MTVEPTTDDYVLIKLDAQGKPVATPIKCEGTGLTVPEADDYVVIGHDAQGKPVAIVANPDCGAAPNPCDPDPEMLLTVTGASGTINWCGQTWNLPADSGVEKSVCPTSYSKGRFTVVYPTIPIPGYKFWDAYHFWEYGIGGNSELWLRLSYGAVTGGSSFRLPQQGAYPFSYLGGNYKNIRLKPAATLWQDMYRFYNYAHTGGRPVTPVAFGTYPNHLFTIGALNQTMVDTYSSYSLRADFFGSYTNAGITYAWAKGAGW